MPMASTTEIAPPTSASTSVGIEVTDRRCAEVPQGAQDARRRRQRDRVEVREPDVGLPQHQQDRGEGERRAPARDPAAARRSWQVVVREERLVVRRDASAACRPARRAGPGRRGSPSSPATGPASGDPRRRSRRRGTRRPPGSAGSSPAAPGSRRRRPDSPRPAGPRRRPGRLAANSNPRTVAPMNARASSGSAASQSAVAGEDDLVEVREAVVTEGEGPQVDAALGRLDALPGRERDDEVRPLRVQRVVGRRVERHRRERPGAAVGLDDRPQRRLLVRIAESRVRPAVEVARTGDVRGREDRDLLRGVLEDRHHRHDRARRPPPRTSGRPGS